MKGFSPLSVLTTSGEMTRQHRGVPKTWFKKGWDILKDELPKTGNLYYLDHDKLKVKKAPKGGSLYG